MSAHCADYRGRGLRIDVAGNGEEFEVGGEVHVEQLQKVLVKVTHEASDNLGFGAYPGPTDWPIDE